MNYPISVNFRETSASGSPMRLSLTDVSVQVVPPVNQATENQSLVCRVNSRGTGAAPQLIGELVDDVAHQAHRDNADKGGRSSKSIDEALIAGAIAGVVRAAQRNGQTIEELQAEMLADHQMLAWEERCLLNDIVTEAWKRMAIAPPDHA